MRPLFLLIFAIFPICHALSGEKVSDDVTAYFGIPYAQPPIGELRWKNAVPVELDTSKEYAKTQSRCLKYSEEDGRSEDCLYVNVFQHSDANEKDTSTLLIVTNEALSTAKILPYVSKELNVAVASVREGILGHFSDAAVGISDIETVVKFLKANAQTFHVGKITLWAEGSVAEAAAIAVNNLGIEFVERSVLVNGNHETRTIGRETFAKRAAKTFYDELRADEEDVNMIRSLPLSKILTAARATIKSFYPFADPFRVPAEAVPEKVVRTIFGMYKQLDKNYPTDSDFTAEYQLNDFHSFLAGATPDSLFSNTGLIRRLLQHQYINLKGDIKNTYHLFQQMRAILHDRDFLVATDALTRKLMSNKDNTIWLFEYGIDNPPVGCLEDGGWGGIEGFCDKMMAYFTRFATKGAPTKNSCEPGNPTFPVLGQSKRDYYVIIKADGKIEWDFDYHKEAARLWNALLPEMSALKLGSAEVFPEFNVLSPLDIAKSSATHTEL